MPKKKKKKINKKALLFLLLVIIIVFLLMVLIKQIPTRNIFIYNNEILSDQEIIEYANLTNYPNLYEINRRDVKNKLLANDYILSVEVNRKRFSQIHIYVEENYPLFFLNYDQETVLLDGTHIAVKHIVPVLINYVPDVIFEDFVKKFGQLEKETLAMISEIQYIPNEVDQERFVFYMIDGNYVYANLDTMNDLNEYLVIMKRIISEFGNKKGILYLDAGGYFSVFD